MIRKIYKRDYRGYEKIPKRRTGKEIQLLKYSKQKDRDIIRRYLMEDFNSKCVYCGWQNTSYSDSVFHIEHTKSKSKNGELIDDYQYLALACPVCNCSKNNKEVDYYIDPIDPDFQKLFYRNKYGAIVVNKKLSIEETKLAEAYLKMIGLHKELYKIDYVYGSLNKILHSEMELEKKDCLLIVQILEIIHFIDRVARRKTNYTDF
ncbi:hypothetical protein DOK67_0002276 [Enterococcus sp. DIV0212c]|nr:HNH endonuclease signature motif containing protein [Enterococcus sp. DIV0212c]